MKLDAADQEAEDAERAAARQKREEEAQLRADGELVSLCTDAVSNFMFSFCRDCHHDCNC